VTWSELTNDRCRGEALWRRVRSLATISPPTSW
jgi:hypothetical protein